MVIRSACISLWTQSIHLPLGLFPATLMSTIALTSLFSSILSMCPYQRSLISLTFSCILFTPSSFLVSTLFTLSLSVTPLMNACIVSIINCLRVSLTDSVEPVYSGERRTEAHAEAARHSEGETSIDQPQRDSSSSVDTTPSSSDGRVVDGQSGTTSGSVLRRMRCSVY